MLRSTLCLVLVTAAGAAVAQPGPTTPSPANPIAPDPLDPVDPLPPSDPVPAPPSDPSPTSPSGIPDGASDAGTLAIVSRPGPGDTIGDLGFAFTLGGGVEAFLSDSLRSTTNPGGNWDVRASIGTKKLVGFEASYFGSTQTIRALGLSNDATLVGNGIQGNVRVNFTQRTTLQPFAFGGLAWRHYDLRTTGTNLSDVNDRDNVLEVPVGVGLAYRLSGVVLDARGEFRATTDTDLVAPQADGSGTDMHRWGFNANVGYEF